MILSALLILWKDECASAVPLRSEQVIYWKINLATAHANHCLETTQFDQYRFRPNKGIQDFAKDIFDE